MKNLILPLIGMFLFVACETTPIKKSVALPYIGEKKLAGQDGKDTIYHTIQSFSFTNQYNETVSEKTIEGNIVVADFFFATCQSICPKMSSQLVHVQNAFKADKDVLILSHTVNPAHDTVEVLKGYGESYGAIKNKWHFLTGNKKEIYDLARYSYLVNALEEDGTAEGFLHSELLILVDANKNIRGMYDGTDSLAVVKLIADIKLLKEK
jgi:protein SCO1/2